MNLPGATCSKRPLRLILAYMPWDTYLDFVRPASRRSRFASDTTNILSLALAILMSARICFIPRRAEASMFPLEAGSGIPLCSRRSSRARPATSRSRSIWPRRSWMLPSSSRRLVRRADITSSRSWSLDIDAPVVQCLRGLDKVRGFSFTLSPEKAQRCSEVHPAPFSPYGFSGGPTVEPFLFLHTVCGTSTPVPYSIWQQDGGTYASGGGHIVGSTHPA